jgi:transposase
VTAIFGVGPVVVATVIGAVRDVSRFPGRDRFAAYDGTAPIEVSSGNRTICRLSRRGNRRLNHVIHMAAVTQIRYRQQRRPRVLRQETGRRQRHRKKRSARSTAATIRTRPRPSDATCRRRGVVYLERERRPVTQRQCAGC